MEVNLEDSESAKYSDEVKEELENVGEGVDYVLHLNYQQLKDLPKEVYDDKYGHVKRIYMKQNLVKSLPPDIKQLRNLVELYLHSNVLEELPSEVGDLENLESLDVSFNQLTTLPPTVGNLKSLQRLQIQHNRLTTLPPEIGELKNLQVLDVMNNAIRCLPSQVTGCSHLERLLVDRNQLSWLPNNLVEMPYLQELSASGNQLLCLPLEMGEMKSLKSVYVDNNPFLHAVPVGLDNQEIGFSSCGSDNYEPDNNVPSTELLRVVIQHSENEEKTIYLPREMQVMCDSEKGPVLSLFELALRATYMFFKRALCPDDLPRDVLQMLRQPVSLCQMCRSPIFTMGHPLVFEGQLRLYSLYRLCMCCSPKCVKLAALIINLPLVYPSSATLHYAVALIDPQPPVAEVD